MRDLKSMMGHIRKVYHAWPQITIEKGQAANAFEIRADVSFRGIDCYATEVISDMGNSHEVRRALSNLTAKLFRRCGELALASITQIGGEHGE